MSNARHLIGTVGWRARDREGSEKGNKINDITRLEQ